MVKETVIPDEVDHALLNALQIAPRAPWRLIADVLGISPITVARHWEGLNTAGLAWVTVCASSRLMRRTSLAIVAITGEADSIEQVGEELLDDPYTVNVAHTAGDCDLLITVWTPDRETFARYLVERLVKLAGVCTIRTSYASEVHSDGSHWRLQALSPDQQRMLREAAQTQYRPASFHVEDRQLVIALSHNGRASYQELATRVGASSATVRRRLRRVLGDGAYQARCEMSRQVSGFPVEVTMWLTAPTDDLAAIGQQLAVLPNTRLCASVVDNSNLVLVLWLRSTEEVASVEAQIARLAPSVRVTRRALTLRQLKLINRVLDGGRAGRVVPADVW